MTQSPAQPEASEELPQLPQTEVGKCFSPPTTKIARCAFHKHTDPKNKKPSRCTHPVIGHDLTAAEIRDMQCPYYTPNTASNVEMIDAYRELAAKTGAGLQTPGQAQPSKLSVRDAMTKALGASDSIKIGRELVRSRDGKPELLIPQLGFTYIDNVNKEQGSLLEFVARAINDNEIAVLIGHLGTGKTTGVMEVCRRINAPLVMINCDGQLTVDQVIGSRVPAIDESGNTVLDWVDAPLLQAYRNGYIACIDDYTFTGSDVFSAIFGLMTQRSYQVLSTGEIIERHPEFRLFLTTNPPEFMELYPNRQQTDAAFLSRIQARYWADYLPAEAERKAMKEAAPMLNDDMLNRMQRVIGTSREYLKNREINFAFSTRHAVAWAKKVARLGDFKKGAYEAFVADMESEAKEVMIKDILDTQVEK